MKRLVRQARADALRDMMRAGVSPRTLLLSRVGVSPRGLAHLQATARPLSARRPD